LEECVSEEPEPSGHERWKWEIFTRRLVSVPLPYAPTLLDIGVSTRSIGRHSHIRLTDRQGERAEAAFAEAVAWAASRP